MKKHFSTRLIILGFLLGLLAIAPGLSAAPAFRALVYSKTTLFRHKSITNGVAAIKQLGAEHNFAVDATEDASVFTTENLARYQVVVFLNTSGDILDDSQQAVFQNYLRQGGGLAGIHAAIGGAKATEGNWPWYGELVCAEFASHPAIAEGAIDVEDRHNPSTAPLPVRWVRTDEWYNFNQSPRGKARVLARLDESTYKGGTMGDDHPIAWCRKWEKGRVWYTALGHTEASYTEPLYLQHILGGIQIAAGVCDADFSVPAKAPPARKP